MKKISYNATDKYTTNKFNPVGISKEDGYNCLSLALNFCKEELDLDYDFDEDIFGDINWNNVIQLFNDKPNIIFNELEKYFLNYYDIIPPHQMRKGDILVVGGGIGRKVPSVFVGNNKILLSTNKGIKVISLQGITTYNVYRVKTPPKKITTKASYKLNGVTDKLELIDEESYIYNGPVAECEAVTGISLIGWIIRLVIMLIISYFLGAFDNPDIDEDDTSSTPQNKQGLQVNTRSTQVPLKVVYGLQRIGGNDVYISTHGFHNKYMYIIQTLSEGVCDSIHQIDGVDQIFIDDKIYTSFGSTISYQFYSGSDSQTYDPDLHDVNEEWIDNLRYTSYIRWRFTYDENLYRGIPNRILDLKGMNVLDFRDNTTDWSQNAVLCLYDYFTDGRYGLGVDATTHIDINSWITAANYFDAKGWKFNYATQNNTNSWAVVQDILKHFRAAISWFDGKYYLLVADINEESSVMVIEDKHIVQDGEGVAQIKLTNPSRFNKPKGVRATFNDETKNYIRDDILVGDETGVVSQMSFMGYTDRETVANLATYQLERLKLNRIISGTFRDDCLELAPHDLVTFNSSALSISNQAMRVVSTSFSGNGLINLILQYESVELYDDNYDVDIEGTYTCYLPDPNNIVGILNPEIFENTFDYRLRTESRLHVTFTVSDDEPWFAHCEVWQAIINIGDSPPEQADYEHQFNTTNNFNIDHVEQGKIYYITLIPVSIYGVKEIFDNAPKLSELIIGNSSSPQNLPYLSAIASNNSLTLFSDKLDDPDIEIYEFRLGLQDGNAVWHTSMFLSSKRTPNEQLPGIKPGTFKFFCKPIGSNGMYSLNPVDAIATIQLPIGWTLHHTFYDDYSSGEHDNTEQTDKAGEDYLQRIDSTSVDATSLISSYTSNVFDTGVVSATYYIYLNALIFVYGGGSQWDDPLPYPNTWNAANITTKTWDEIFEIFEAPKVNITIYYQETLGSWDTASSIKNAEILSAIVDARYFKVKIEIEDPIYATFAQVENFELKLYTTT